MTYTKTRCNVVHSVDYYRNLMIASNNIRTIAYDTKTVEELLKEYHNSSIPDERKNDLKEQIIFKTFFLFPYIVRKSYSLPIDYFDDAMMNLLCNLLTAIEHYDPERGTLFSNYLIGYCRDAMAQTVRSVCVVAPGKARRAMVRAAGNAVGDAAGPADGAEEDGQALSADGVSPPEERERDADSFADESGENDGGEDGEGNEGGGSPAPGYGLRSAVPLDESRLYETGADAADLAEVDAAIHNSQLTEWLVEALSPEAGVVSEDERQVLIGHYGLFGQPRVRYRDIAEERKKRGKGGACSRISQIKASAVLKLRRFFQKNGIESA